MVEGTAGTVREHPSENQEAVGVIAGGITTEGAIGCTSMSKTSCSYDDVAIACGPNEGFAFSKWKFNGSVENRGDRVPLRLVHSYSFTPRIR